ncbi:MAG: outer membrane beta-barrel protein [Candidatus Latescibacterota bacterium]|nr:MAG: outer membrane beta-barrel protein [Candidatus Latescibacterota bacterium]
MRLSAPLAFLLVLIGANAARAQSGWLLEAVGMAGAPLTPQQFTRGWGAGLGIGGSLRVRLTPKVQVGIDAEFIQFTYTGLPRLGGFGGERRYTRVGVPLRWLWWERESSKKERLSLQLSAGWGRETIEGITGDRFVRQKSSHDGLALSAGLRFSRSLYRTTRWSLGARYTYMDLGAEESPGFVSLLVGMQMPLEGSRPRSEAP